MREKTQKERHETNKTNMIEGKKTKTDKKKTNEGKKTKRKTEKTNTENIRMITV